MRSMSEAISGRAASGVSMSLSLLRRPYLERRNSNGRSRILDWNRKSNADENALRGGIENTRDYPDNLAVAGHQRPAGISRIHRGVELDQIGQQAFAFRRLVLATQSRNHTRRGGGPDAE